LIHFYKRDMSDVSSNSDTIVRNDDNTVVSTFDDTLNNENLVQPKPPSSKTANRLQHQTAASKSRVKAIAKSKKISDPPTMKSKQMPPRPPKVTSGPKPASTPTKKNAPKKACSTPTSEDVTISDMTLDASCISVVNRTRAAPLTNPLDDTVCNEAPVLNMQAGHLKRGGGLDSTVVEKRTSSTSGTSNSRRHTMVPPRNNISGGKVGGGNISGGRLGGSRNASKIKHPLGAMKVCQSGVKVGNSDADANIEDEEITDEMMNVAYTRYLQAKFIQMKSRQAKERAEKECQNQLYRAFSATENLRQEIMRKQEEKIMWTNIAMMKKSLEIVETKLAPALKVLESVNEKLNLVGMGLDKVKHNLLVQGVNLADQETAAQELESLSEMFKKFNHDVVGHRNVIEAKGIDVKKMAQEYSSLSEKYSRTVEIRKECKGLLEQADRLTAQEASLAISLSQLEMERKKKQLVNIE